MRFRYRYIIALPVLLLVLFSGYIFATQPGLVLVQKSINRIAGSVLTVGGVEGTLNADFILEDIRINSADQSLAIERIAISWKPLSLFLAKLDIRSLAITGLKITFAAADGGDVVPGEESISLPSMPLLLAPLRIEVDGFSTDNIELVAADGEQLLQFDRLKTKVAADRNTVAITDFDLQGRDIGLSMHGNINTGHHSTIDLIGQWRLAGFGFHPMSGAFSLAGPVEKISVSAVMRSPGSISIKGTLTDLLKKPSWTAKLDATEVNLSTWILDCPEIEMLKVSGDLSGDFAHYRGTVKADALWGLADDLHLDSELDGDDLGIFFKKIQIRRGEGSLSGDGGSISWEKLFSWSADLRLQDFDPSLLSEKLQGRLSGEFASLGDVTEQGLLASFELDRLYGALQGLPFSLKGKLSLTEDGISTTGLQLRSGEIEGLARIESAKFMWDEGAAWSGKVWFDKFDPAFINPEFYGQLSGGLSAEGYWNSNGVFGDLLLTNISGTLRDNQLSGGGNISITEQSIESSGFSLKMGASELQIKGGLKDQLALGVKFSSPDLQSLLPGISGAVVVQGDIAGSIKTPRMDFTVEASDIVYEDTRLKLLRGNFKGELLNSGDIDSAFQFSGLAAAGLMVDKGSVVIEGSLDNHQIKTELVSAGLKAGFRIKGSYLDVWKAKIEGLYLTSADFGDWRQRGSAALEYGDKNVDLSRLCIDVNLDNQQSSGCFKGRLAVNEQLEWSTSVDVEKISLGLIETFQLLPFPELALSGEMTAGISATGDRKHIAEGRADFKFPRFALNYQMGEIVEGEASDYLDMASLSFDNAFVVLKLADRQLQAKGGIRESRGGELDFTLNIDEFGDFDADFPGLGIGGDLNLDRFDVSMLGAMNYQGIQPSGWVTSNLNLGGTIGRPKLNGDIRLEGGGVALVLQGITLEDLQLGIDATADGIELNGQVRSGGGILRAKGNVEYSASGLQGGIKLLGEDFLLVNLPEYTATVNPDLQFSFNREKGEMKGRVLVVSGLIAPEELSNSVRVSEDVEIIGDDQTAAKKGWPFSLQLEVVIGEDVRIDGYGLTGRLGGDLHLNISPGESITGRGDLDLLEGKYSIYGKVFDISRGRLLFTGGPIDNPGVDVRAQSSISNQFSKEKGYTVGIDISGLVQDLQYRLFSDPYMTDSEILSNLILGHSVAGTSAAEETLLKTAASSLGLTGGADLLGGLGDLLFLDDVHLEGSPMDKNVSFVLGKRITKDMYVGYDVNMFSNQGQFRVRYDLTRGFWVETESSTESTGADLLYTFER
jgi:translocation and assembly module TamB